MTIFNLVNVIIVYKLIKKLIAQCKELFNNVIHFIPVEVVILNLEVINTNW